MITRMEDIRRSRFPLRKMNQCLIFINQTGKTRSRKDFSVNLLDIQTDLTGGDLLLSEDHLRVTEDRVIFNKKIMILGDQTIFNKKIMTLDDHTDLDKDRPNNDRSMMYLIMSEQRDNLAHAFREDHKDPVDLSDPKITGTTNSNNSTL